MNVCLNKGELKLQYSYINNGVLHITNVSVKGNIHGDRSIQNYYPLSFTGRLSLFQLIVLVSWPATLLFWFTLTAHREEKRVFQFSL